MIHHMQSESVVREFWRLMATNDFQAVRSVLAPGFVMEWPQSRERIRGAEYFARMNAEYPTQGRWSFTINRLVCSGDVVVTQVSVSDGLQTAEPISFFMVTAGKIEHLVEYWPDPFEPSQARRHLVERMT
jgi:predicted SnoaL-like aldol condensation-catalyzing enzyme